MFCQWAVPLSCQSTGTIVYIDYDYNWLWYNLLWYVSPEFLSQHFGKDGGEKKVPRAKEADLDERSSSMLRRREKLEQSEQWRLEFWKTMWYNGVKEKWWVVKGPKSRKIKRPYGLANSGVQLWGTCDLWGWKLPHAIYILYVGLSQGIQNAATTSFSLSLLCMYSIQMTNYD